MFAPFKLRSTLGRTYNVDLDDTLRTKKALRSIGLFDTPKHGLTTFPDEPLFKSIEIFQRAHGLRRDGIMKPNGETATALGRVLGERERITATSRRNLPSRATSPRTPFQSGDKDKPKEKDKQVAAAGVAIPVIPQIPAIAGAIAGMLGLTLPLKGDTRDNDKCDDQLEADLRRCGQIARGNREIYRRCQKSAMERYANCIAGRPLGPLDEGH